MASKIEMLQERREILVKEAALQRQQLQEAYLGLQKPMEVADKTFQVANSIRRSPWIILLASAALGFWFFRKPRKKETPAPRPGSRSNLLAHAWKLGIFAFGVWKNFRRFRPFF